jgi:hypothetical protein
MVTVTTRVGVLATTDVRICETCGSTAVPAREMILAGRCPICRAGPFRVPLSHVTRRHGLGRDAARRLFGLAREERACDPEHSERHRQLALSQGLGR